MARIEVEVRTVVRRIVVEVDDRPELLPRVIAVTTPRHEPRPSGTRPTGSRRRRLAVAGGSVLVAAGLALGEAAARRWSGRPALPARPGRGRLPAPARRAVPALPARTESAQ